MSSLIESNNFKCRMFITNSSSIENLIEQLNNFVEDKNIIIKRMTYLCEPTDTNSDGWVSSLAIAYYETDLE